MHQYLNCRIRLVLKNIKSRKSDSSAFKRIDQRHFVNNTATRTVDDSDAVFHRKQLLLANDIAVLLCRYVKRDKIRMPENVGNRFGNNINIDKLPVVKIDFNLSIANVPVGCNDA